MSLEKSLPAYYLKLFVAGQTAKSDMAIANLRAVFEMAGYPVELMIIDVLEQPELAEEFKILATPTLIKLSPLPVRRIIGDLSDEDKLRLGLGLRPGVKQA